MTPEEPKNVIFHYNRERRLEHAPEIVRRAYDESSLPVRGFLRGLTANAGLRSIFFVIIMLSVIVIFMTVVGNPPGTSRIENVPLTLKSFLFDETVYITLAFDAREKAEGDPVPVSATLTGIDPDGTAVSKMDVAGVYANKELILRATMPDYEIKTVQAAVKFNKTDAIITVSVDRK